MTRGRTAECWVFHRPLPPQKGAQRPLLHEGFKKIRSCMPRGMRDAHDDECFCSPLGSFFVKRLLHGGWISTSRCQDPAFLISQSMHCQAPLQHQQQQDPMENDDC